LNTSKEKTFDIKEELKEIEEKIDLNKYSILNRPPSSTTPAASKVSKGPQMSNSRMKKAPPTQ
jgi:hypothetical protein